jgi:hypothetical protein
VTAVADLPGYWGYGDQRGVLEGVPGRECGCDVDLIVFGHAWRHPDGEAAG